MHLAVVIISCLLDHIRISFFIDHENKKIPRTYKFCMFFRLALKHWNAFLLRWFYIKLFHFTSSIKTCKFCSKFHSFAWIKLEFIRNSSDYLSCVLVITFQLFMKAACPPTHCSNNISMHVQGSLPCNFQIVNFILVASLQIRDNKKKNFTWSGNAKLHLQIFCLQELFIQMSRIARISAPHTERKLWNF